MTPTKKVPFGDERQQWLDATVARLNPERLKALLFDLTDIHSPTGAVREASEFMTATLEGIGMSARYMPMNDRTGNVLAEKRGTGGGAAVMLYCPIDTHLEGNEDDYPWVGPHQFIDLHPKAKQLDDWVYGLGASNPKG